MESRRFVRRGGKIQSITKLPSPQVCGYGLPADNRVNTAQLLATAKYFADVTQVFYTKLLAGKLQ